MVCVGILMLSAASVHAGVAVSPMQQWVSVEPGGKASVSFTLNNVPRPPNTRPIPIKLQVTDFSVSPDGTLSFGPDNAHARSAAAWVSLDMEEATLQPEEIREIKATVSVPANADGDYWAAVLVTLVNPQDGKGVNLVLRTASGIFVHVARRNHLSRPSIKDVEVRLPEMVIAEPAATGASGDADAQVDDAALSIKVEVANEGVVSFDASGTATLYLEGWRKAASIPLHADRRRILPGDTRYLTGVLPSPLPEGRYKLRALVGSDDNAGRKAFAEKEFEVSADVATRWQEHRSSDCNAGLKVAAQEIRQTLSPGRFTTESLVVANDSDATMSVRCRLLPESLPETWLTLSTTDFTLGPKMQRSVLCRIMIPKDTEDGEYKGTVLVEADVASLQSGQGHDTRKIPIGLTVKHAGARHAPRGEKPVQTATTGVKADE